MTTDYTRQVRDLTLAMGYVYLLLREKSLFYQCEAGFVLWLARIAISNIDLFSREQVDIEVFKDASRVLNTIYHEIGGIGGRK